MPVSLIFSYLLLEVTHELLFTESFEINAKLSALDKKNNIPWKFLKRKNQDYTKFWLISRRIIGNIVMVSVITESEVWIEMKKYKNCISNFRNESSKIGKR